MALSALALLAFWSRRPTPPAPPNQVISDLAEILDGRRLFEPRLTGGFGYAPCAEPAPDPDDLIPRVRCSEMPAPGTPAFDALVEASAGLRLKAGESASPAQEHASSVWRLLWTGGQEHVPTRVIDGLERVSLRLSADDPERARSLSDLSAAYLVRAAMEDRPLDLIRALDAADRALEASPALPEALFNRALARERLHLRQAAKEGWEEYLAVDSSSPWADEARARYRRLDAPSLKDAWEAARPALDEAARTGTVDAVTEGVRGFPHQARTWVEETLLAAWATDLLAGRQDVASRTLDVARLVATTLATLGQGSMAADAVAAIDRASGSERVNLAEGHQAFADGLALIRQHELERATVSLERAEELLGREASPFADWATFYLSYRLYYSANRQAAAAAWLENLRQGLPLDRYPVLEGRIQWMLGLTEVTRDHLAATVPHYLAGIGLFQSIGHPDAGTLTTYLAGVQQRLGKSDEAWENQLRALAVLEPAGSPDRLYELFFGIVGTLLDHGEARLAVHFEPDLVAAATDWGEPGPLADAHLTRSRVHLALDKPERALDELTEAEALIRTMPYGAVRDRVEADYRLALGSALVGPDPTRAVASLSEALRSYKAKGHTLREVELLTSRADAQRALGASAASERDLLQAIRLHESLRRTLASGADRIAAFDHAQRTFDSMVTLQLDGRNDPLAALSYADRSRARELLDAPGPPPPLPGDDRDLLALVPAGSTVVEYSVLPDRLVLFTLRRGEPIRVESLPVEAAELARRVSRLRSAIEGKLPIDEVRALAAPLFEALVRPAVEATPPGDTLVLIPDRSLHRLPFAALWDTQTERYLIERHPIVLAPSLRHALAPARTRPVEEASRTALAVGVSPPDCGPHADLDCLPEAESEAGEVAALLSGGKLLVGEAATPAHVLEAMPRANVIHFAAHAVSSPTEPASSYLALAPGAEPGATGELPAQTIETLRLPATDLVFLSACQTIETFPGSDREGHLGLARSFLMAGAESVVASLWRVDDRIAARLTTTFYKSFSTAGDPAQAIRRAQLDLIEQPDPRLSHPETWAGFAVIRRSATQEWSGE